MTYKEYTIFITCNGGRTYNIHNYTDLRGVKKDLYNMVDLERERNRPYYVFNDFFDNEYPANVSGKIFCVKERKVTEWEKYSDIREYKNNIYKFPKMY